MGSTRNGQIILLGLRKTTSFIAEKVSVLIRRVYVEEAGDKQLIQNICGSLTLKSLEFYDAAQTLQEKTICPLFHRFLLIMGAI